MAFKTTLAAEAERDLDAIFEFLVESFVEFGEPRYAAISRAGRRIKSIRKGADAIARAPHRGTLHKRGSASVRHITIDRAIFWFEVIDALEEVRVLGIFFGGQDHHRHMLARLLREL